MTTTHRPYLDRRLNNLQYNVQQEINIKDSRIKYFAEYYQSLQAQISVAEDDRNRLNMKSEQIQHAKKGKIIHKMTDKQILIAKMIKEHEQIVNELLQHNELETKALKEDFENTYEEIDKMCEQKEIEKSKPVEEEIKRTIGLINKMKTQTTQVDNSIDNSTEEDIERTHEYQNMMIQSLEAKLKEMNQNRLSSLLEYKRQLQECVNTLEELENRHISQMEQLRDELDGIDANYKEQVKRNSEKQKKDTIEIKRNIKEIQEKVRTISKSINTSEKRHKNDILKATQESETLRMQLLAVKKKESKKREGNNEVQNYQKQLSELNSKLKERESILMKVRADNETLKKEIARISQEKQIAQRRAALHII